MHKSFIIFAALPAAVAALGACWSWSCFGGRRKKKKNGGGAVASGGDNCVGERLARDGGDRGADGFERKSASAAPPAVQPLSVTKEDLPTAVGPNAWMCAIGGRKIDLSYRWDNNAETLYYAFGPDGYQGPQKNAVDLKPPAGVQQMAASKLLRFYVDWAVRPLSEPEGSPQAQRPATREPAAFFLAGMLEMSNPTAGITMTTYLEKGKDDKAHLLAVADLDRKGPKAPWAPYYPPTDEASHVTLKLEHAYGQDGTLVAFTENRKEGFSVFHLDRLLDLCKEDNEVNQREVRRQFSSESTEILLIALPDLKRMAKPQTPTTDQEESTG